MTFLYDNVVMESDIKATVNTDPPETTSSKSITLRVLTDEYDPLFKKGDFLVVLIPGS